MLTFLTRFLGSFTDRGPTPNDCIDCGQDTAPAATGELPIPTDPDETATFCPECWGERAAAVGAVETDADGALIAALALGVRRGEARKIVGYSSDDAVAARKKYVRGTGVTIDQVPKALVDQAPIDGELDEAAQADADPAAAD